MRKLFLAVSLLTILAMLGTIYMFLNVTPITDNQTVNIGIVSLFLGLILVSLTGLTTLLVYYIKRIIHRYKPNNLQYLESLRHGFLASVTVVTILVFSMTEIANTVTIILCVVAAISIEWYFQSQKNWLQVLFPA